MELEQDILDIAKGCFNEDYSRGEEEDFVDGCGNKNKVYKVQSDDRTLYYWNSSNQSSINHGVALKRIGNELLDGEEGGTVYDGWNEIMYEIKY